MFQNIEKKIERLNLVKTRNMSQSLFHKHGEFVLSFLDFLFTITETRKLIEVGVAHRF